MFLFKKRVVNQLLNGTDKHRVMLEIDVLLSQLFFSTPDLLSLPEKNIVYIGELEREVNNGGFEQFFNNVSGDYTEEVINALRIIGSIKFLHLVELATQEFYKSFVPRDREERIALIENLGITAKEKWQVLDEEFFKYEEDIYGLMIAYIKKNIRDFR
jgi:hypothetical protein